MGVGTTKSAPADNINSNNGGMAPTDLAPIIDQQQIVEFTEDRTVKELERILPHQIGNSLSGDTYENRKHDIIDFMGRPFKCFSGSWTTGSTSGSQLVTMEFPEHIMTNPMYRDKLRGFLGFRATTVIRLQVNSERFQQGRLILHYLPMARYYRPERLATALQNLSTITQQPRVDFDLSTDTEVKLRIPFINVMNYYNLQTTEGVFGTFYVTVYSPLVSPSGPSDVSYSIWCHFEDVEVDFPTYYTQMAISSNRRSKTDPTIDEADAAGVGPISGLASKISKATGIMSEIPLLSSFTAPVSWAADVFSRSAKAMGWSKPTHMAAADRAVLAQFANMATIDSVDMSQKLSLSNEQHLENLAGFAGTDVDEMAFGYLAKIPAFINVANWSTVAAEGTELGSYECCPIRLKGGYLQSDGTVNKSLDVYPPGGYIANLFNYWRSSITFTFKIVKTEFHSGRLVFAFAPYKMGPGATFTYANSQYCYREVVDIRSTTEVKFTVPFASTQPYLRKTEYLGYVKVFVLNPLRAPDTVSSTVSILAEVSYGDDFEVAWHVPPSTVDRRPMITQMAIGEKPMDGKTANVVEPTTNIGTSSVQFSTELSQSRYCIGERILSVRQLLKRFTKLFEAGAPGTERNLKVRTHAVGLQRFIPGSPIPSESGICIDMINYFAPLYAFMRGGERYKYIQNGATATGGQLYTSLYTDVYTSPATVFPYESEDPPSFVQTAFGVKTAERLQAGLEVEVPGYWHLHSRVVPSGDALDSGADTNTDYSATGILFVGSQELMLDAQLWRAASDDYSLGFFIGTVPLVSP